MELHLALTNEKGKKQTKQQQKPVTHYCRLISHHLLSYATVCVQFYKLGCDDNNNSSVMMKLTSVIKIQLTDKKSGKLLKLKNIHLITS